MLNARTIEVISEVPGLKLERMSGVEALGRPFEFEVDLLSASGSVNLSDALGRRMTVVMSMGRSAPRFFSGVIARMAQVGIEGENFRYRAQLRPWLWLSSKTRNSRTFQSKDHATIIDVLEAVWRPYGQDFDMAGVHKGDYPCPEYLVQYQESDLDFASRLMEQTGLYYYFRHETPASAEPGRHILVLHAGLATEHVAGYETIRYFPPGFSRALDRSTEHLDSWSLGHQVEPSAFVAKEFDFVNPRATLVSASRDKKALGYDDLEVFEYPGRYIADDDRQAYVTTRRQGLQLTCEVARGTGTSRGITPGFLFAMTGYPAEEQNRRYLVTSASYEMANNEYSSGTGEHLVDFRCNFAALDGGVAYRTPLSTTRPTVGGPQTAIVVGPRGEEIWTDKYGRVKVQFHWDRAGSGDDNSSCWVRVAQVWAGAKWGAIHIPRVGQEVVVDFLEGDPDRPIVTGRVYNGDNPVPYDLPANQTQSGIKSRSTPAGSPRDFNEIRFEDRKGNEELHVRAQRDQTTYVNRNRGATVGGDDIVIVGGDRNLRVAGNLKTSVRGGGDGSPQSHLDVIGDHWLTASRAIDICAPSSISLSCSDSFLLMEPGRITLGVGKKGKIVIDASVCATSAENSSSLVVDGLGSARLEATTDAIVSGRTVAANAVTTAEVNGDRVIATGKSEATIKGGPSACVKAHVPGVDLTGTLIKMNG